jgi:hypothetical protein
MQGKDGLDMAGKFPSRSGFESLGSAVAFTHVRKSKISGVR